MSLDTVTSVVGKQNIGTGWSLFESTAGVITGGIEMDFASDGMTEGGGGGEFVQINGGVNGSIEDLSANSGNDTVVVSATGYVDTSNFADSAIYLEGGANHIVNAGTLSATYSNGLTIIGASGADDGVPDTIINTGSIFASMPQQSSGLGAISCTSVAGIAINNSGFVSATGGLPDAIYVTATGGSSSLDNSGHILGAVDMSGGSITLNNSGVIQGSVTLASAGSSVINQGVIDGDVQFGSGGDTFDSSYGAVTGAISAGMTGDTIIAGQTGGKVVGGAGNDRLFANPTQTAANNAAETTLDGKGGTNWLTGDGGYVTFLAGDSANDVLIGHASQMIGVSGYANNTVSYANLAAGESAYVNLINQHGKIATNGNAISGPLAQEDSIQNIPNVIGSNGNDLVFMGVGAGEVTGGLGADTMYAGGNGSQDTFIYTSMSDSTRAAQDWVQNFKIGTDKIDLTALGLGVDHLAFINSTNNSSITNPHFQYVALEKTAGTFNASTDLWIGVNTTTTTLLSANDVVI